MPLDILLERVAEAVNTPQKEAPDALGRRLARILPSLPQEKIGPATPRKEPIVQVGPEILEAEGHTMASLMLGDPEREVESLRAYPGAVADIIDRVLEIGAEIGHWQRVEGAGPGVLARFGEAQRREAEREEVEAQTHRANGSRGGKAKATNAKRKKAAEKVAKAERNEPRMQALEAFRRECPNCTLPDAALALLDANVVPSLDAGKKWLRRMAENLDPFEPGKRGRPLAG